MFKKGNRHSVSSAIVDFTGTHSLVVVVVDDDDSLIVVFPNPVLTFKDRNLMDDYGSNQRRIYKEDGFLSEPQHYDSA